MVYPVRLRGQHVVVRELDERDIPLIHEYASDPEVTRFMTWGPNASVTETAAFARGQMAEARRRPRDSYELVVASAADDELVGRVRLTIESEAQRRGDLGYVVRRARWGRGYATEAARLVLGFGFETLRLHRIEATCSPENAASVRVLEKIGMRREGHFREHVLAHGLWRDSYLYAILEEEWPSGPTRSTRSRRTAAAGRTASRA